MICLFKGINVHLNSLVTLLNCFLTYKLINPWVSKYLLAHYRNTRINWLSRGSLWLSLLPDNFYQVSPFRESSINLGSHPDKTECQNPNSTCLKWNAVINRVYQMPKIIYTLVIGIGKMKCLGWFGSIQISKTYFTVLTLRMINLPTMNSQLI